MSWFRVDDTLAAHPKTRAAGLAAMGLWTVSGSWSSQQLTEGFVPEWFVATWPNGKKLARALVVAGYWEPAKDGDVEGWLFHDWTDANPTAEKEKERRRKARDRQRKLREESRQLRGELDRERHKVEELRATQGARVDPKAVAIQRIQRAVEQRLRSGHFYEDAKEDDIVAALVDLVAVRSLAQSARWDLERLVRAARDLTEPLKHTAHELGKLAPPLVVTEVS